MAKAKTVRRTPKRLGKTRTQSTAWKPARLIHPPRAGTKQSRLIDLLRRPQGMTLAQACAALGWKAHTVRGAMAGALKGRLRLKIESEKPEIGDRVYRIID